MVFSLRLNADYIDSNAFTIIWTNRQLFSFHLEIIMLMGGFRIFFEIRMFLLSLFFFVASSVFSFCYCSYAWHLILNCFGHQNIDEYSWGWLFFCDNWKCHTIWSWDCGWDVYVCMRNEVASVKGFIAWVYFKWNLDTYQINNARHEQRPKPCHHN